MLVVNDVCVRMVFVWEETGVPGGNPPVWLGDHMTISHADTGYRTWVAAVRGECVNTASQTDNDCCLPWYKIQCVDIWISGSVNQQSLWNIKLDVKWEFNSSYQSDKHFLMQ